MKRGNHFRSKFVIDMSVPSSMPSLDGPTVTKTRPPCLEVVGSSIVNPFSDLTTQLDDLMTSSDNDRGLAEQSREAREDFVRTISRLKEESQPSLAYLEQFQTNPDNSAPVLESLVILDSPEIEETIEDLSSPDLFPPSEHPVTLNTTHQLSSPDTSHPIYRLVLESDAESLSEESFTLKKTSTGRKFGGSQGEADISINAPYLREISSSDPQLFSLNPTNFSHQETPLISISPPLRDRSTSDPCLGCLKSFPSDTGVLSLPNLLQSSTPSVYTSQGIQFDNPYGSVFTGKDSEISIEAQEEATKSETQSLEADSIVIHEFGNIPHDYRQVLEVGEYLVGQTSAGQINMKNLQQFPTLDDQTKSSLIENDEIIHSEIMSELDLTSHPTITDVITVNPPTLTDHEPQTSQAFIPRGRHVVDNMWNEFSFSKFLIPTPKAKKSLRTTIPQPFSVYYKSLQTKKKTKAQIQGETERRLKLESEERECSRKFVSKPVPKSTFEPRYRDILTKEENRRQQITNTSKNNLQLALKPFKFDKNISHQNPIHESYSVKSHLSENQLFKAKPVPKHLFHTRYEDEVAEQDLYREIRKVMRTNQLLSTSKLPPSMSASERTLSYTDGHKRRARDEQKSKQAFLTAEHRFKPTVNKRVPDFQRQQRLFEQKMLERRQEQRMTRLEFSDQELTIADLDSGGRKNLEIIIPSFVDILKVADTGLVKKRRVQRVDGVYGHAPTRSTQLRQSLVQQRISEQVSKEKDERERAFEQKERTERMKRQVTERVKRFDTREEMERRAEEKKKHFKEMEESRQTDYEEHLRMIKEKLEDRPLVFERVAMETVKERETNRFSTLLRKSGVSIDELNNTYSVS